MYARARNTASADELSLVLRGAMGSLDAAKYLQPDLNMVCEHFEQVMAVVLRSTPRPTAGILATAAMKAFGASAEDAKSFGQRLAAAYSFCSQKCKSSSSGKKLHPAVFRIGQLLSSIRRGSTSELHVEQEIPHKEASASWTSCTPTSSRSSPSASPCASIRLPSTTAEILNIYCPSRVQPTNLVSLEVSDSEDVLVISSQEDLMETQLEEKEGDQLEEKEEGQHQEQKEGTSSSKGIKTLQYLDSRIRALVRTQHGQVIQIAKMLPGEGGFAVAQFEGEDKLYHTELPNLLLETTTMEAKKEQRKKEQKKMEQKKKRTQKKKPKAKVKKPTCKKRKASLDPPAQAEEDQQEVEEEEEEVDEEEKDELEMVQSKEPAAPKTVLTRRLLHKQKPPAPISPKYKLMFYKRTGAWAVRQCFCACKQIFQLAPTKSTSKEALKALAEAALLKLHNGEAEEAVKNWAKSQL